MSRRAEPLRSMTGYGRGAAANATASAEVELRSVNGKAFHLKLRMPADRLELEPQVESQLRSEVERGSMQGQVRVKHLAGRPSHLDHELLRRYLKEWRRAERELGIDRQQPSLADLLALPGVVEPAEETTRERRAVARAVLDATKEAVARLIESREREGERLRRELLALSSRLKKLLGQVEKHVPKALEAASKRFRERVQTAWEQAGITDPMDLTRELAVLADRADVREEVARLGIHQERLDALVTGGGRCGRELEFLIQECHREVTTLGSKSADDRMSELVVAMKVAVGRLKEQAANVE